MGERLRHDYPRAMAPGASAGVRRPAPHHRPRGRDSAVESTQAAWWPPTIIAMVRLLLRAAVFLGSSAIGLLAAAWLIPGVSVSASGFIVAVVVFTVAQAILSPFIFKMASRYASAFLGGIGLVSTLVALVLASVFTHGLSIRGPGSWIAATVVVWVVTAMATLVLPLLIIRNKAGPSR